MKLLDPKNSVYHNALAVTFMELGDFKKSIIHLCKSLNLNPNNTNAINNLVYIFKRVQLSNLSANNLIKLENIFIFLYKKNSINHNDLFNNAKILIPLYNNKDSIEKCIKFWCSLWMSSMSET